MPGPRNSPKAFSDWYESDYFRRPRRPWILTLTIIGAMIAAGVGVAFTFGWSGGRRAYQAGPLSDPHAFLADNCQACHTNLFATAARVVPGHGDDHSTPDSACLACHKAGVHNPDQTKYVDPHSDSAANCAGCHREHYGGASIANLSDAHCTECHRDLHLKDDKEPHFGQKITHFDDDHPAFGAWRGKELYDPGTIRFNHKVHLELAQNFKADQAGRNAWMANALDRLKKLSCTACHEPDNDRRYIRSVSYDRHCAECHPLMLPAGDPKDRLHHPKAGENADTVRDELLGRFWKQLVPQTPAAPPVPADNVLNRDFTDTKAKASAKGDGEIARQVQPEGYEIATLERQQFAFKSGCAYCHEKNDKPLPSGLPDYKAPRLRDRWQGVPFPHERFGPEGHRTAAEQIARDRWFPYAKFSHESHRMLECVGCHKEAKDSTATADVLMPKIEDCRKCHNRSTTGVRSDCLECHIYHDRGTEPRGLDGRMTIEQALDVAKPGGGVR